MYILLLIRVHSHFVIIAACSDEFLVRRADAATSPTFLWCV